jgi:hypothetical protein
MALAPVPTTATRAPASSTSWSQAAEWKTGPAKSSRPGTSGSAGRESPPGAATSARQVSGARPSTSMVQRAVEASHVAAVARAPNRIRSRTPKRRAQSSR